MPQPDRVVIRLVLVDDQTLFREGLRALVDREPDLEVVAEAAGIVALEGLDVEPDVVVTGLEFADAARAEVVQRIRTRFDDAAVLVLSIHADLATVRQALADGAHGYVLKSAGRTELLAGPSSSPAFAQFHAVACTSSRRSVSP